MGSAFHQLCPRYSGTLTPTAPTAIRLWETFTFTLLNVQKGKSNMQVDPSSLFAPDRASLFTPHHIYTHAGFEGRPKQECTVETLK